jgi:protein-tyrosine phosphatase
MRDGHETRFRGVVRCGTLDLLTEDGWSALLAHGVRTIVDLRDDDERQLGAAPPGIERVHVPLDDKADREFWEPCIANQLARSPLYYGPFLERKSERCVTALRAIAAAPPGGVVVHCAGGRDRTGLVSLLLLALADVAPEQIAADYELSNVRLRSFWAARGLDDEGAQIAALLASRGTSARALLLELLATLDAEAYLLAGGLREAELGRLRDRLLAEPR